VFEFLEGNIYQQMKRGSMAEDKIKNVMFGFAFDV
jgi:hypothetical protein